MSQDGTLERGAREQRKTSSTAGRGLTEHSTEYIAQDRGALAWLARSVAPF